MAVFHVKQERHIKRNVSIIITCNGGNWSLWNAFSGTTQEYFYWSTTFIKAYVTFHCQYSYNIYFKRKNLINYLTSFLINVLTFQIWTKAHSRWSQEDENSFCRHKSNNFPYDIFFSAMCPFRSTSLSQNVN